MAVYAMQVRVFRAALCLIQKLLTASDSHSWSCRWRTLLTSMLQQHYCRGQNFYWISQQCDNPDQRIAQDVNIFCERLASMALVIAATPFQAVYYTVWTYQITSGYVILAVHTFFLVSLLLERLVLHQAYDVTACAGKLVAALQSPMANAGT